MSDRNPPSRLWVPLEKDCEAHEKRFDYSETRLSANEAEKNYSETRFAAKKTSEPTPVLCARLFV